VTPPAPAAAPPLLLLFDLDGTLLRRAADAHRDALYATVRELFGVDRARVGDLDTAGRTDIEIARLLLTRAGVAGGEIDAALPALREAWCRAHDELCADDLRATVLPGIAELLGDLASRDDVRVALLTGNLEPIARRKLAAAGIGDHFPLGQGAFGSDHEVRAELPPIARRRAALNGEPHPCSRTVIIGDTPRDIACARADGLRCLAVATGPFTVEQLAEADGVAASAAELAKLLATLA
jgi:phosphoglycolate phosphatase-like HAD superfamily hydrolase